MYNGEYVSAVIPAAGVGARMKTKEKKQYIVVNGKEILEWTLRHLAAEKVIDEFIVVVGAAEKCEVEHKVKRWMPSEKISVIAGGQTRYASVKAGLAVCSTMSTYVFIHDGVRPFVQGVWLTEMLHMLVIEALDGIAVGQQMVNTVKRANRDAMIIEHVDRSELWMIETPQLFRTADICNAYRQSETSLGKITDDTQLMTALGKRIKLLPHEGRNDKITTLAELTLAEAFLK
ncbi:2-C-methyl-D-erythritol 4-phosphate cytidylyltransferase [Fusibacter paucivorans]|uniref:2-C-methyl-D-erythritol 4-phosphate cytidylyltransferase n=1 Tax=Fusibacter paucivorans TaxID=76009 RepID=A0ABS5PU18_9FIRM|nr:2-C-methyl-D-erythritol 4-phosphate cytidylyltransferase [Fusibacter paucivorans]MBS7528367.1 2-C-methyl-D-erythritol 4-phosphate cytidylyltransferase [Fusibacter paucivorans]